MMMIHVAFTSRHISSKWASGLCIENFPFSSLNQARFWGVISRCVETYPILSHAMQTFFEAFPASATHTSKGKNIFPTLCMHDPSSIWVFTFNGLVIILIIQTQQFFLIRDRPNTTLLFNDRLSRYSIWLASIRNKCTWSSAVIFLQRIHRSGVELRFLRQKKSVMKVRSITFNGPSNGVKLWWILENLLSLAPLKKRFQVMTIKKTFHFSSSFLSGFSATGDRIVRACGLHYDVL